MPSLLYGATLKSKKAQNNLRLYPWFYVLFHCYAWAAVFFLYFSERVTLQEVLSLEALYYIAVVILEVPSGYFSDVIGRKKTLVLATIFQTVSYALFFWGSHFFILCLGQVFLAFAFSFASGTDQSFHFESLKLFKREAEFGDRESKIMKKAMLFRAIAQLCAGALAVLSLRYAYGLSLLISLIALFIVVQFQTLEIKKVNQYVSFLKQLKTCFSYLKNPQLLWITGFIFTFTICTHFPYEFMQKYFALLDVSKSFSFDETPLVSGLISSCAIFIAAFVAGKSITLEKKIGFPCLILLSLTINGVILLGMSYFLSVWVVALILMRSIPSALSRSPLRAKIAPLIQDSERATYMSINSLIGRLGYGVVLLGLSKAMAGQEMSWHSLSHLNQVGFYILIFCLVILSVFSRRVFSRF